MDTFPSDVPAPSIGTSSQHYARMLVAEFGDGYGHRLLDGINAHHIEWAVSWQLIARDAADKIEQFLVHAMGMEPFLWLPPKANDVVSVICDLNTLKRTPQGQLDNVAAVFVEVKNFN